MTIRTPESAMTIGNIHCGERRRLPLHTFTPPSGNATSIDSDEQTRLSEVHRSLGFIAGGDDARFDAIQTLAQPRLQAAGLAMLARLNVPGRLSDETCAETTARLDRLEAAAAGRAADGAAWQADLSALTSLLQERVVLPTMIENQGDRAGYVAYSTGFERQDAAQLLELRAGPLLTERIYAVLRKFAIAPAAPLDARLAALDLLGQIGVPDRSELLNEIESTLPRQTPEEVLTLLASVKVRTGRPSDDDMRRLQAGLEKFRGHDAVWFPCLEALLLADETKGLGPTIEQVVRRPAQGPFEWPARCLNAMGCSEEGRDVLVKLLGERSSQPPLEVVVPLCLTAIAPTDRSWAACLDAAEALALDERLPTAVRIPAALLAAKADQGRPWRTRYVRPQPCDRKTHNSGIRLHSASRTASRTSLTAPPSTAASFRIWSRCYSRPTPAWRRRQPGS